MTAKGIRKSLSDDEIKTEQDESIVRKSYRQHLRGVLDQLRIPEFF